MTSYGLDFEKVNLLEVMEEVMEMSRFAVDRSNAALLKPGVVLQNELEAQLPLVCLRFSLLILLSFEVGGSQ